MRHILLSLLGCFVGGGTGNSVYRDTEKTNVVLRSTVDVKT